MKGKETKNKNWLYSEEMVNSQQSVKLAQLHQLLSD